LTKLKESELKKSNGDIYSIMRASAGGSSASDTTKTQLKKTLTVLDQVSELKNEINKTMTGPIVGIIRSNNPWDTKAQEIKARIQAIVPNLARGVYSEVGVLTDNDINNYIKTLPNLKSPEELTGALLSMTLNGIKYSLDSSLKTEASLGTDVSGFVNTYKEAESKINKIAGNKNKFSVNYNGKIYSFDSQDKLNTFKQKLSIK
jgi:hypothetical protein